MMIWKMKMAKVTLSISVTTINGDGLNFLLKDKRLLNCLSCTHICINSPNWMLFARLISETKWATKAKYKKFIKYPLGQPKKKWDQGLYYSYKNNKNNSYKILYIN